MDFIEQEAEYSDSSDSTVSSNDESNGYLENFIDDREYSDEESSLFANVVISIDGDLQPRLYNRVSVDGREIGNFEKDKHRAEKFRKTLLCFSEQQRHEESNLFFLAVVYGIYYLNNQNQSAADLTTACDSIRRDKFEKLLEIKNEIMLHYKQFGFWKKILKLNEVLSDHFGLFLRFYERRNEYRYLLRKRVDSKNKMHSEVSNCAVSKFDGYEYLRSALQNQERKNLQPLDIVYEPTKNVGEPIHCYLTPKTYLAYSTYYTRGKKRVEPILQLNIVLLSKLFLEN